MVTQEQSRNTVLADVHTQMVMEEALVPKIRKPYTISKQRERWAEEEHEKFLEALKLYGRAWRKIEEHIGTKTTVQIRSHAQKFFSKVVRETNNSNASSTEPIEIPPPRPKRKPSHPYPRKLVLPTNNESPVDEISRSVSPNSSIDDEENQSPTSVLSALDSTTLDCSTSQTSSPEAVNQDGLLLFKDNSPQDDVHVSPPVTNDLVSEKLELFPSIDSYDKPETSCTKVLKLFGKEVVVPSAPSNSAICLSKSPSSDMGEELFQASPENSHPVDTDMPNIENSWDCRTFYYVDGSGNQVEKPIPLPWWVFFRGMVVPPFECHVENAQEKGTQSQREGSCEGSSNESVNGVGNTDTNWDVGSQSDKESKYLEAPNVEKLLEERSNAGKDRKGFVPYKRRFSERDVESSTESISEKEDKRVRLCL